MGFFLLGSKHVASWISSQSIYEVCCHWWYCPYCCVFLSLRVVSHLNVIGFVFWTCLPISSAVTNWYTMVQWHVIPLGIYGGQSVSGRGFCPITSITPCQYQSSDAPYSLFYHRRHMASAVYSVVMPHTLSVFPLFRVLEVTLLKCVFLCLVRQRKRSLFSRLTCLIDRSFLGGIT